MKPSTIAAFCTLAALGWFTYGQDRTPRELAQGLADRIDPRPARHILILGNRRTSANGMPAMLRRIADSAHAPQKFETLTLAPGGASLETLDNDWRVAREVRQRWDDVIVQGESRALVSPYQWGSFMAQGRNLFSGMNLPQRDHAHLIVNWVYDRSLYKSDAQRAGYYDAMQQAHADLARQTGAHAINIGKVWEQVHADLPQMPMTTDTNLPTPAASYLVALCLYADLSGGRVGNVTWAPASVPAALAASLRGEVDRERTAL